MNQPTFSIVIPHHDGRPELRDAVQSVRQQTVSEFELIVVNDMSPIHPRDILGGLDDSRIKFVEARGTGPGAARNTGITVGAGVFQTFLDSDDTATDRWLEVFLDRFDSEVGVVCCGARVLVEVGETESDMTPRDLGPAFAETRGLYLAGTFAYRRDPIGSGLLYDPHLRYSENTELGMRLARRCVTLGFEIETTDEMTVRLHESNRAPYSLYRADAVERILEVHGEKFTADVELATDFMAVAGVASARARRWKEARSWFVRALRLDPRSVRAWGRLLATLVPGVRAHLWPDLQQSPDVE